MAGREWDESNSIAKKRKTSKGLSLFSGKKSFNHCSRCFLLKKKNSFHVELATSRPILAVFLTFLNQWLAFGCFSWLLPSRLSILNINAERVFKEHAICPLVVLGTSRYLSPVGGGGRGIWWDHVFQGNQGGRVVAISLIEYTGGNYRKLAANQLPMRGLIRILQGLMGRSGDFLS